MRSATIPTGDVSFEAARGKHDVELCIGFEAMAGLRKFWQSLTHFGSQEYDPSPGLWTAVMTCLKQAEATLISGAIETI